MLIIKRGGKECYTCQTKKEEKVEGVLGRTTTNGGPQNNKTKTQKNPSHKGPEIQRLDDL